MGDWHDGRWLIILGSARLNGVDVEELDVLCAPQVSRHQGQLVMKVLDSLESGNVYTWPCH